MEPDTARPAQTIDPELAAARARLQHVVLASNTVIYMLRLDPDGPRMDWVSENVSRLTGYTEEEVRQDKFLENLLHPDEANRILAKQAALLTKGEQSLEYRALRRDNQYVWVRDSRRLLRDPSGRPSHVVGAMVDITEQKSLEAQLFQAQKMDAIGKVVGGIAHDFNNLMTAILGTSEFALRTPDLPAGLREDFNVICDSARRAGEITRQLLAFGRKQMIHPRSLELNAAVLKMLPMLRRAAGLGIDVHAELAATGAIEFDPVQIEQVALNLVVNARDAMPNGGVITVATRDTTGLPPGPAAGTAAADDPFCVLEISDTGIGMDEATQARIFEPFFSTKGVGQGSGLGLATVYGLVQQSDGHIFATSTIGHGSTFTIYLRRLATPPNDMVVAPPPAPDAVDETILVVEDEGATRSVLCRALRAAGYRVLEARHGPDALAVLERHRAPVDLVLTDVVMPEMTGIDLVAQVRSWYPRMRALFISGYSEDLVDARGAPPPGTTFMPKPFDLTDLVARVRSMLDER